MQKPFKSLLFVASPVGLSNIHECLQLAPILNRSARGFAEEAKPGG
jgi:hypothetical protein